jgi:type VI secretion system protein ImpJ
MATTGQVHWHEGLFLQPHHLQWMQRQALETAADERRLSWAYPYGVIESRLSGDALENMLVRFDRLRAVMPSGVEVIFPDAAEIPPLDIKKVFEGSTQPFTVSLGVPLWYASRANSIELGSTQDWREKRVFKVVELQRPDENTGENPQPVLVRKVNARLLLETDDRTDLETLPLVRITHATGKDAGLPRQDNAFIPPCMVLSGWPPLRDMVRDLVNQVEARRKEVVVQLTRAGFSIETLRGIQFEQILRLTTLNRFSGRLPSMVLAPGVTPLEMYLQLRELLGELAALRPDRDQFDAPRYDHDNPAVAFLEVAARIRKLLGEEVSKSYLETPFAREESVLAAALTDEHLSVPNDYFLGIKTKQDSRAVSKLVESAEQFKLMAWSMREKLIFGVKLTEERHPPVELPAQTGLHYFRLMRAESTRMWDRIKEERKVALKWPELESSDFDCKLFMTVPGGGGGGGQG